MNENKVPDTEEFSTLVTITMSQSDLPLLSAKKEHTFTEILCSQLDTFQSGFVKRLAALERKERTQFHRDAFHSNFVKRLAK
jgi:hypothetical protein